MEWIPVSLVVLIQIAFLVLIYRDMRKAKKELAEVKKETVVNVEPIVNVDTRNFEKKIEDLPNKVLQSITSSSNTYKGKVGELIGYMKLHAEYDRIIPMNNIADFIGIRFSTSRKPGTIDFIDVKTGKGRLSKDQKELQKLVKEKKIDFKKLKVSLLNDN